MTLRQANAFVADLHRHHQPVRGCVCCIGLERWGTLCGVAIIGRPVARRLQDGYTAEVTRLCTDGTKHACSMLYGATWRAVQALGYKRLITYTLPDEGGASLRGAGFKNAGLAGGGSWNKPSRPRIDKAPLDRKWRWEKTTNDYIQGAFSTVSNDIKALHEILVAAWSAETSTSPDAWTPENPSLGQCAVTALIVQDEFGGELKRATVNGISHYWNHLLSGEEIDLTRNQFGDDFHLDDLPATRTREYVLSYPATVQRYRVLKTRAGLLA